MAKTTTDSNGVTTLVIEASDIESLVEGRGLTVCDEVSIIKMSGHAIAAVDDLAGAGVDPGRHLRAMAGRQL